MQDANVNLNQADCIATVTNWGEYIYYNICSGTEKVVPWGTMDYVGTVMILVIAIILIAAFLGLLKVMLFE